jgi:hypothetical protein
MVKLIASFLLVQLCFTSWSQTDSLQLRRRTKIGFYSDVSGIFGNFSNLNNAIAPQGYPAVRNMYSGVSYGYSIRKTDKRSYTSFSFSFLYTNPSPLYDNSRTNDVRLRMFEFKETYYYNLVKEEHWLAYPYLGLGFGLSNLTLYSNLNQQSSFATSISNLSNPTSKTWTGPYLYLHIGVGVERRLRISIYDFYLGLGGGYRLSTNTKFYEPYQNYSDSPTVHMSGLEWNFRIRFEIWRHVFKEKMLLK